ncbi:MAG: GNAT family N-acetyltransferase [Propionivibrio sp.]
MTETEGLGFFGDAAWFEHLMNEIYPWHHQFRLYCVTESKTGRAVLLAPLRVTVTDYAVPGGLTIGSVSHPENYASVAFVFDPANADLSILLTALFHHLKQGCGLVPPFCAVRLWPIESGSDFAVIVRRALRHTGFWVQAYDNSLNRYEDTRGLTYDAYFKSRSANSRYNIVRRRRALHNTGPVEFTLYLDEINLDQAIADYADVARASWKEPETMISEEILQLIRLTAQKGVLRLGILRFEGSAVAAQFWILTSGIAYCTRLAYRESHKHLAVGTVLTDYMIAHLLDHEHVSRIDFGYGHEDYKASWMKSSREYSGFLAFNPGTGLGLYHGARHIVGRALKRSIKRCMGGLTRILSARPATPSDNSQAPQN